MRWLIDEMLPPALAEELQARGHDAVSIAGSDLAGMTDEAVYDLAVEQQRILVTENFADFNRLAETRVAAEGPVVPVIFVRKRAFPRGRALAAHLARHIDEWAADHPDPYPGPHWP